MSDFNFDSSGNAVLPSGGQGDFLTGTGIAAIRLRNDEGDTGLFSTKPNELGLASGGVGRMIIQGDKIRFRGDFQINRYREVVWNVGDSGTSKTLSLGPPATGTLQRCTLTGNCTFTMPTIEGGRSFTLLLRTGTGNFSASFTGVKWPNGVAPSATSTANRMDIFSFVSDGVNWYGTAVQNYSI